MCGGVLQLCNTAHLASSKKMLGSIQQAWKEWLENYKIKIKNIYFAKVGPTWKRHMITSGTDVEATFELDVDPMSKVALGQCEFPTSDPRSKRRPTTLSPHVPAYQCYLGSKCLVIRKHVMCCNLSNEQWFVLFAWYDSACNRVFVCS